MPNDTPPSTVSSQPAVPQHFGVGAPARRLELDTSLILVALIGVGAFLRLVQLDALSFRWDEDLSALAAKAIAEHGIPELPSGMIYARAIAFSYLMAAFGIVLGFSEAALRMPAVLFGIATIPLAYAFGRSLFDARTGLVLAALVALSTWDIEFSRYARMYAPFGFFYLLTLLLIWRHRIVRPTAGGAWAALASALVAVSLHDLAYTLAFAFLLPLVVRWEAPWKRPYSTLAALASCGVVAATVLIWQRVQGTLYDRAAILAGASTEPTPMADTTNGAAALALDEDFGGPIGVVVRVASRLRLPDLPWVTGGQTALIAGLVMALALSSALGWLAFRRRHERGATAFIPLIAALVAFKLFNIALLAVLLFAFTLRRGIAAFRSSDVLFSCALVACGFGAWLAVLLLPGGAAVEWKPAIKSLLDFPSFFVFWGFPKEYMMASIPALIGALWIFDRVAQPTPNRAALFFLGALALPTVFNGLFETRYHFYRYNVPFGPLFFTLIALGLVRWREVLEAWTGGRSTMPVRPAIVTVLLGATVLTFDFNPVRSWLVATNTHDSTALHVGGVQAFRDFRGASEHVLSEAGERDLLIAFDCREYYNYLGRLDYCIMSGTYRDGDELIQTYVDRGELRDLYIGTPMITSVEQLEQVMSTTRGETWVLASDRISDEDEGVDPTFVEYLERQRDHVHHVALDGVTRVWRF